MTLVFRLLPIKTKTEDKSTVHYHFGNIVAEEIKNFPHTKKLKVMTNLMLWQISIWVIVKKNNQNNIALLCLSIKNIFIERV